MRRPTGHGITVVFVLVCVAASACSKAEPVDPASARRERVEVRLRSTFSATQTRCILRDLSASDLSALDRKRALSPDDGALEHYSTAISSCVTPPGSPSPAVPSSSPATTTATTGTSPGG